MPMRSGFRTIGLIRGSNKRPLSTYHEKVKELREDLAAAFRLVHMHGWSPDLIYNHISVRLPMQNGESRNLFLINPYGLGYEEITASSLVVVDQDGNIVDKGSSTGKVNAAGFVVHAAVHNSREDLHAVMHTHEADAAAVSTLKCGLLPLTQDAMVFGEVRYHEYEGIAIHTEECARLATDLGPDSKVMVLRNHGILACAIQVRSLSAAGGETGIHWPKPEVVTLVHAQAKAFNNSQGKDLGALEWAYLKRKLERHDTSFKL